MAHPFLEYHKKTQAILDKAGVTEIRLADNRAEGGIWYCNLVVGAAPRGFYGEGDTAITALLDALRKLTRGDRGRIDLAGLIKVKNV
jgi:hypothetical protein